MKSVLSLSLMCISALSGACVDQLDDDQTDTTDVPRLAANGMTPNQIQVTTLDAAALTGAGITSIAATADGRSFLTYLVGCALTSSQTLTTTGSTQYSFTGTLGLASGWTSASLSGAERKWVSACMLARANSIGTSVGLSLRGTHTQLYLSGEGGYGIQEGTFYGDIFFGGAGRHACADIDVINRPTYGSLKTRVCAYSDNGVGTTTPCGFIYDGLCASTCSFTSPNYTTCTDSSANAWTEVIKVNLLGT